MARFIKTDYCLKSGGLVIIIWGLAGPALSGVFEQAIERVSSF
jgi:hypothetical protein